MREPGDLLLVACYELGHQPLAVAWPAAFLERAGYRPALMDTSVEPLDAEKLARAKVIAVSVPMHTALRLGLEVAARARAVNPAAHVCFFGLYATLNAEFLFAHGVDTVIGGEVETPLLALVEALERGDAETVPAVSRPGRPAAPHLRRLDFPVPSRAGLPAIKQYTHLERDGRRLRLWDPAAQAYLLTPRQRAQQEALRAQQEALRARQEALRADQAEAEVERLRAELKRLREQGKAQP